MSYQLSKDGQITINGFGNGIATSPHTGNGQNGATNGVADLKGVNISSINGEVSVSYNRIRQDNVPVSGGTLTFASGQEYGYSATNLTNGTWIKATQTAAGLTINTYYLCTVNTVGTSYNLYTDMGVTAVSGSSGTCTFNTVDMGMPIDFTVEQSALGGSFRYYILDLNGIIWANGTTATLASAFNSPSLSSLTTWQAITPQGTSTNAVDTFDANLSDAGSIQIMYATDGNNVIKHSYLMIFTTGQIKWCTNSTGWPSISGSACATWQSLNYTTNTQHKSILGNDQVLYFTDGPGVGIVQQKTGQQFLPSSSATYNYVNANYLMAPTDSATRIAQLPAGNGLSIVVGGQQNNIYIYPTYQNSTGSGAAPTSVLWTPEHNVQYLLQTNNYILIFTGNKGNIYLTNGSSVVPLMTVPDYVAGSANFVQDPYYIWGGAMYLRGRVFFSIKDQTSTHTGNCGGVWSFVPSFSYFVNQDTGLALRMESASAQYETQGFNGYAPILFAGQNVTSQQLDGPQYIAGWSQGPNNNIGSVNSIDFSGTSPLTNSSSIIETDAIPVGTFLNPKTFNQIEVKFASQLVSGESVVVNYRTDLEASWTSAGTMTSETAANGNGSPLSQIIQGVVFQQAQIIQLQIILSSTVPNQSWCRLKEIYIR